MGNDTHSVVYFVNEAYGVVIRVNGATGEAAMWEREKEMFSRRIDARLAAFLQDVDKIGGKWCVAHPTYCRATAEAAAKRLIPRLPGRSVMELARAAKREYMLGVIRTQSADETIKEISAEWKKPTKRLWDA